MNYGFRFFNDKLCVIVSISGNAPNASTIGFEKAWIDTGASNSCFPETELLAVGAIKGLLRPLQTANGVTEPMPTYEVRVSLGIGNDLNSLSTAQLRYKKLVENKLMHVYAPKIDIALIGRDILKRYNKIYVNWYDRQVVNVDLG